MKSHIAIYGTLKVRRMFCRSCKCWTIIAKDGKKICCNKPYMGEPKEFKRMIEAVRIRRGPSERVKKILFEKFDYSCCYCGRRFGSYVSFSGIFKKVKVNWDHKIPFSYSYNNAGENFLPACNFCNGWKSSKIFQTMEEAKLYVNNRWEETKAVNASL